MYQTHFSKVICLQSSVIRVMLYMHIYNFIRFVQCNISILSLPPYTFSMYTQPWFDRLNDYNKSISSSSKFYFFKVFLPSLDINLHFTNFVDFIYKLCLLYRYEENFSCSIIIVDTKSVAYIFRF